MAPLHLVVFGLLLLMLLLSPVTAQSDEINDTVFLLTDSRNVMVLNLQGEVQHEFSDTYSSQVDFDPTTERIFWPDSSNQSINRAFLNGSHRTVHQLPSGFRPVGVAVDYILQLVFYSVNITNLIGMTDTDGGSHRIVRNQNLTSPWALAVDVIHEFLYYTENRFPGNIGRMDYYGGSHEILHTGLFSPRGLALDVRGGRMFWSTYDDGKVVSARLDGTDRSLVWQDELEQLGLAFFDGVLYFTVFNQRSIFSVNVTGTILQSLPLNVPASYVDIAVYNKSQTITLEEKLAALARTETPSTATPRMEEIPSTATPRIEGTPSIVTHRNKEFVVTPSVFLILTGMFVNFLY